MRQGYERRGIFGKDKTGLLKGKNIWQGGSKVLGGGIFGKGEVWFLNGMNIW